jgi:hypothetical protein
MGRFKYADTLSELKVRETKPTNRKEVTLCNTDRDPFAGIPIDSVKVALIPLPLPASATSTKEDLPHPELHRIRVFANKLRQDVWTESNLIDSVETEKRTRTDKNWGWTLFSASVKVPKELLERAGGGESKVALVAFASEFALSCSSRSLR